MSNVEGIIMIVFVAFMVIGLPVLWYFIERDKKRQEEEEWKRKRK
jgi:RsiW-degrading membrane proteinase PrsW (M82 family)